MPYTRVENMVLSLIPDAQVRTRWLSIFRESILEANRQGANKWGTYHTDDRVRLLVGSLIVQTLHQEGIWLALDRQRLDESLDLRHMLDMSPNWKWDTDEYPEYTAVPSKNGYYTPSEDMQLWPMLKMLHFSFIDRVAEKYQQLKVSSQANHMPDLLMYLRQELQEYVPDPVYEGGENFRLPEELPDDPGLVEGSKRQITINAYERNPQARQACIAYYGTGCVVCGFKFASVYGKVGEGFIHVHHLRQLADMDGEYQVDPITDLRPVCPNCHAMIHKGNPPYSIKEVKEFLRT